MKNSGQSDEPLVKRLQQSTATASFRLWRDDLRVVRVRNRGQSYVLMFLHAMEKCSPLFPRYGKLFPDFSTLWKTFRPFFHAMENFFPFFPRYGKMFSTPWKTLPALAAAALVGCSRPPPQALPTLAPGQDVALSASLSTNRIRIGDPVELTLAALHRDGTTVAFPSIAKGKDVVVRSAELAHETFTNGLRQTRQTIAFTSLTVTNHVVGENAPILHSTPGGTQTNAFPFVSLEVVSSLAPDEKDPRPAKGELARWPAPPSRRIGYALAALALLAAAFFALRKFLSTPRTILHRPPPVPPHEIALNALADLRSKGWIEALKTEPFYVELSAIVRRYLEARFALRAPERTTEEFIRDALSSRALSDAHRDLVAGFLEQSDLVKFARHAPGQADMRNALDSAERLVRETIPGEPKTGGGGAP